MKTFASILLTSTGAALILMADHQTSPDVALGFIFGLSGMALEPRYIAASISRTLGLKRHMR